MPDWMSHLIIGLILAELFNVRKKSLVVLGAFMPDLIAKLDLVLFYFNIKTFASFSYFHTPLMCFLISILIAPLFRYDRLNKSFPVRFNYEAFCWWYTIVFSFYKRRLYASLDMA